MFIRTSVVVFSLLILSACGGKDGVELENPSADAPQQPELPTAIQSVSLPDVDPIIQQPESGSTITVFDSIEDNRFLKWWTEDNFEITMSGLRTVDGNPREITDLSVKNENNHYLHFVFDRESRALSLESTATGAMYELYFDQINNIRLRVEIEDQFSEFVISNESSFLPSVPQWSNRRSPNFDEISVRTNMDRSVPSSEISVGGCPAEIDTIAVNAFAPVQDLVRTFRPLRRNSVGTEYDVLLPGLSRSEAALLVLAESLLEFLKNYDFFNSAGNNTNPALLLVTDQLRGVANEVSLTEISTATDKLDQLDEAAEWLGIVDPVSYGQESTFLVAVRALRILMNVTSSILNMIDLLDRFEQLQAIGEATSDFIVAVQYETVYFEVVIETTSGETIRSETELVSSDGPYPFMFIEVPCTPPRPLSITGDVENCPIGESIDFITNIPLDYAGAADRGVIANLLEITGFEELTFVQRSDGTVLSPLQSFLQADGNPRSGHAISTLFICTDGINALDTTYSFGNTLGGSNFSGGYDAESGFGFYTTSSDLPSTSGTHVNSSLSTTKFKVENNVITEISYEYCKLVSQNNLNYVANSWEGVAPGFTNQISNNVDNTHVAGFSGISCSF